jgi:hypothetical protein
MAAVMTITGGRHFRIILRVVSLSRTFLSWLSDGVLLLQTQNLPCPHRGPWVYTNPATQILIWVCFLIPLPLHSFNLLVPQGQSAGVPGQLQNDHQGLGDAGRSLSFSIYLELIL